MDGSELHRIQIMDNDYDIELFNRLYHKLTPLIKNLSKNIDERRYNLPNDIIQSYFSDKFLFVFNKYSKIYDEERLKATLITSLRTYKNKLLQHAYSKQAEFYQTLNRLDDTFESSKEIIDDSEESIERENKLNYIDKYMKDNLSMDAYLIYQIELNPPLFITEKLKNKNSKITIVLLLDFFNLRRTKSNSNFISNLKKQIEKEINNLSNSMK